MHSSRAENFHTQSDNLIFLGAGAFNSLPMFYNYRVKDVKVIFDAMLKSFVVRCGWLGIWMEGKGGGVYSDLRSLCCFTVETDKGLTKKIEARPETTLRSTEGSWFQASY